MRAGLVSLGYAPLPSQANFLYFDCGQDGRALFEALLRKGIIIRHIGGSMVRVSIGLPEENRQCLDALAAVAGRPAQAAR
jgi:histidinol-phosphate aminotransferase